MLTKVKKPIANVNKILYEALLNEEHKNDHMVQVFEQRLQMAQQQHHHFQLAAPTYVPQPPPTLQHAPSFHHQ